MHSLANKQQGITLIGILFIAGILACFVLFGVRAFPLYSEWLSVKQVMKGTVKQIPERINTTKGVMRVFLNNADINSLRGFNEKNVKKRVTVLKATSKRPRTLQVKYTIKNTFYHNLYLMMEIDETEPFPK